MAVIWTNHLYERIKERGLDPSWVDSAVRFPDRVIPSSTSDANKHIKVIGGYEIVAAVKKQGTDFIVKSAWWKQAGYQGYKRQNQFFLEKIVDWLLRKIESMITGHRQKPSHH